MTPRPGVLVITPEAVGVRMAGPAIRALELARAVAADPRVGPVVLASLTAAERSDDRVRVVAAPGAPELRALVDEAASVVVQGDVLGLHPWLAEGSTPVVVDAYDPYHLEQLEQAKVLGERQRRAVVRDCISSLRVQLGRADLVLCASARQRDLWTGHLAALGRVNPVTYDDSHDLGKLVAVVPFGTPGTDPPERDRAVLAEVFPDLDDDTVVLVWGGGVYDWFDPVLLVRAVAAVLVRQPRLRLLFLGTRHPVAGSAEALRSAVAVAEQLGVLGTAVVFHDGWVPYDERGRWLRAADVGVSTHHEHLETRFSFRTRLLDYLWAGLPVITTAGDDLGADMVAHGAARTVPAGSLDDLVDAVEAAATDAAWRATAAGRSHELSRSYAWARVAAPLADFCAAPTRAPDLVLDAVDRRQLGLGPQAGPAWAGLAGRIRAAGREGGWGLVRTRLLARLPGRRAG